MACKENVENIACLGVFADFLEYVLQVRFGGYAVAVARTREAVYAAIFLE